MAVKAKTTAKVEAEPVAAPKIIAIKEAFSLNSETGKIYWVRHGREAGHLRADGYRTIRFRGVAYLAHRLAWLLATGKWPRDQIDHINHDRSDNRIANLRECSNAENSQNCSSHRDARSRFVGVTYREHAKGRPWIASVSLSGRRHFVGHFATEEEAGVAALKAKASLHPFSIEGASL